ncbi:TIM barrel protein [Azospirillum sp. TSH64]|uniref:hydroxypyruvate isomerase family protein n=1 Tax=Azospirillum sp. TSH64 TaxID=652740 RepID=UPI000D616E91|nr:TIM barrel protein [Azospirillum sp. TSH64]PWC78103.1 hydroxypyruvate isomerase [Azospirillum sp. TSH64]
MSIPCLRSFDGRLSAHIGFLFTEQAFAERPEAARRVGFGAVEHPNPFDTPAPELARRLSDAGLRFAQTGFPAGDVTRGEKGFAALPEHVARFRSSVQPTLDYAEAIGCRLVHAMAGVRPADVANPLLWETYLENLAFAADAAATRGIDILIEPIGPGSIANYIIDDPGLAITAIHDLRRPNVGLLMDIYHCVSLGHDPVRLITEHAAIIKHVQIADFPGRHEPGSGTIAFDPIFEALKAVGYSGYIGCEYHPSLTTAASFSWLPAAPGDAGAQFTGVR